MSLAAVGDMTSFQVLKLHMIFVLLGCFYISIALASDCDCAVPCRRNCGNVSIPLPFAIDNGCGDIKLYCNDTTMELSFSRYSPLTSLTHTCSYNGCDISVTIKAVNISDIVSIEKCAPMYDLQDSSISYMLCDIGIPDSIYLGMGCYLVPDWGSTTILESEQSICYGYQVTSNNESFVEAIQLEYVTIYMEVTSFHDTRSSSIYINYPFAFLGAGVISFFGILLYYYCKPRIIRIIERRKGREMIKNLFSQHSRLFSYKELHTATNGFSEDLKLGAGGFGIVYNGVLETGVAVAIKKTNALFQGYDESFLNEMIVLSQVNHKNLVKLLGFCVQMKSLMLVYEYVPGGTLSHHLEMGTLSLRQRLKIAIETATAVSYLHTAATPPIYHRDVKPQNILLDEDLTAKVADFGISKPIPAGETHVYTVAQGTPGYLDPEYFQSYRLTEKSDVYSFGMVLLELITGLKPVDFSRSTECTHLAAFAIPLVESDMIDRLVDPKIMEYIQDDVHSLGAVKNVARLAIRCLAIRGTDRPRMKEVVDELWSASECVIKDTYWGGLTLSMSFAETMRNMFSTDEK